jgi:hypothetical protein
VPPTPTTLELRDSEQTRQYVLAGLWLSRTHAPAAATVPAVLEWLLLLAGEGLPVPPIGFLADLGFLALGTHEAPPPLAARDVPGVDPGLLRRYEDYCLGKLYGDLSFERGADAILRYEVADRGRGLAYLAQRLMLQTGFAGATLNPATIRSLARQPAEELLPEAWRTLAEEGLSAVAIAQYESLIEAVRGTGDLLTTADLFELERGTALAEFGQRLALRQVLQAADLLRAGIPRQKPRLASPRRQVATRLLTEDAYPVGGFSSISTKGSIESLLHSQLVYLERGVRPDLFDVKFVRDELLYYSRDENQFLRRRTTLLIVMTPELVRARTKDASLPYQRIILALGLLVALAAKLREWLSDETLQTHVVLLSEDGSQPLGSGPAPPLADEQALLELLLAEEIEHGTARLEKLPPGALSRTIADHARRSLVRCVVVGMEAAPLEYDGASPLGLSLGEPAPRLVEVNKPEFVPAEAGLDAWRGVLQTLLVRLL